MSFSWNELSAFQKTKYIIYAIVCIVLLVISIQNISAVEMTLIAWKVNISLSLLVILSFLVGAGTTFFIIKRKDKGNKALLKKANLELETMRKDFKRAKELLEQKQVQ